MMNKYCDIFDELTTSMLCRGKRADNGEWVEGYFAYKPNDDAVGPTNAGCYIFNYKVLDWNLTVREEAEVIPESVGRFTGLFDKKKRKIFERSKVNCKMANCILFDYEVRYKPEIAGFVISKGKEFYRMSKVFEYEIVETP